MCSVQVLLTSVKVSLTTILFATVVNTVQLVEGLFEARQLYV